MAKKARPKSKPSAVKRPSARVATRAATSGGRVSPPRPAAKPAAKRKAATAVPAPSTRARTTAKPAAATGDGWPIVGRPAPDFELPSHDGTPLALRSLRGKPVVLYFYPKDDTPGCTVEACGFRDAQARFAKAGAVVLGVSPDGPASHARFRAKHRLPFTLLADEEHEVASRYGAWRAKSMYGRSFMGVARSTFIIGRDGRLVRVFATVKPAGHADEVLAALAEMD
ncbi:MAG: thioredoxin-dependent thiol peroxidase [Planctomycetaceae bacterium]